MKMQGKLLRALAKSGSGRRILSTTPGYRNRGAIFLLHSKLNF